MKSPMNMAPTKMAPTKFNEELRQAKADGKLNPEFAAVVKMKSPMKMGSAYKMDKSAFKLKSAPVNMNTPGSVAKLAGVSPAKHKPWAEAHKARAAHPNSAEAHGKQPKGTGTKPFTDGQDGAASRRENQN